MFRFARGSISLVAAIAIANRSSTIIVRAFATRNHPSSSYFQHQAAQMSSSAETNDSSVVKRVLVPIGDGSEEIETACLTDTLTRFGAKVVLASVMPSKEKVCTMSRGIRFLADVTIDEAAKEEWDLVALPGGMPGAEHLRDSETLIGILEKQRSEGKLYGAVCASPAVVLASKGLLGAPGATCYPAPPFRAMMEHPVNDDVVVQGNLVTSQGPGTSLKFALQLGEIMYGKEKADEIAKAMLVQR